jgi:hypothetical protein
MNMTGEQFGRSAGGYEVMGGHTAMEDLFRTMVATAETLSMELGNNGATPDTAMMVRQLAVSSLLGRPKTEATPVPVWNIRDRTNYSGQRLSPEGSRRRGRIVVAANTGALHIAYLHHGRPVKLGDKITRLNSWMLGGIGMGREQLPGIRKSWDHDLNQARAHYLGTR